MGKERVLHLVNTNCFSGLENVVLTICMLDKTKKHKYVSPEGMINDIVKKNNIDKIDISKINYSNVKRVIRKEKPDIIHAHDFKAMFFLAANFLIIKKRKIKIVSHIHNNHPEMKRLSIRSIIFLLSSFFYKKVIVVSESVEFEYIFNKMVKKKIVLLTNIINDELIVRLSREKVMDNKKYDVIFLGRLTEQKDPIRFVELVKKINDKKQVKAVMLGEGELKNEIKNKINDNQLEDVIDMIGFDINPYKYIKNSKVLLLPSKWEGFGLVALEALCLGKPAVVSNVGGLPNIIDGSVGALCESDEDFINNVLIYLDERDADTNLCIDTKFKLLNNKNKFLEKLKEIYSYL